MLTKLFWILTLLFLLTNCALLNTHNLRESDFPQKTPTETFDKIKASVQLDEIDWAWNTLSTSTRGKVSYTEFSAGWQLYRDQLYRILNAKLESTEPWSKGNKNGMKITVKSGNDLQSFLLVEEGGYWFLEYPSPWENVLPFKTKEK